MTGMAGTQAVRRRTRLDGAGAVVLGGDYQGLGIVRSLGVRGIPVCVIDDERSVARMSRYVQHYLRVRSLRDDEAMLVALDEAGRRFGLEGWVLFPTREENVVALARHRDALAQRFRVPTPGWPTVRACWDKRITYDVAGRLGIAHPLTWIPQHPEDSPPAGAVGPFVIKPAIKEHFFYATGAKAWRVDSPARLEDTVRRALAVAGPGEILVQELVPGGGEEQYAFCALVRDGLAVASMTVRRWRQHPSDFGRASTFVETIDLPELAKPSMRFLASIGYHGLVEVEYKRDPRDGTYKLLDVNARTWGYHSLGPAAGVDFPYLLYLDQTGWLPPEETITARPGRRWIRLVTDVPNAVRDIMAGTLRWRDYVRTLRGVHTEAVFSARDPVPWLYEIALLPYLAMRRGL